MRGYYGFNFKAFFLAQHYLEEAGWEVINPAEEDVEKILKAAYESKSPVVLEVKAIALRDSKVLSECDAIFMLEDFKKSDGATAEYSFARWIGLKVFYQSIVDEQKYSHEGEGGSYED